MRSVRLLLLPLLALLGPALARPAQAATSCPQTACCTTVWTTFLAVSGTTSGPGSATTTINGLSAWYSTVATRDNNRNLGSCADSACDSFTFSIGAADVGYYKIEANVLTYFNTESIVGISGVNDTCEGVTSWNCRPPQTSSGFSMAQWNANFSWDFNWEYVTFQGCGNPAPTNGNARVWYFTTGSYTLEIQAKNSYEYFNAVRLLRTVDNNPTPTVTPTATRTPTVTMTPTHIPAGATYSPTYTPSPTFTPSPLPTVWAGLPTNMRPYGLEYVPFPTVTTSGGTQFNPLDITFSSSAALVKPCNTARWHIVFQDLSDVVTVATGAQEIETRIGPRGVSCLSGVYDSAVYATYTALYLPSLPQNFSSAYFWVGAAASGVTIVPTTEQFDALGDPRFVPYADVLDYSGHTGSFPGGYNFFFRNFTSSTTYAYKDLAQDQYYTSFIPSAEFDHYNPFGWGATPSGPNFDVPKLFALIRQGVLSSNSVYTGMAGYDSYYAGLGGEIGGDSANTLTNGVPVWGGPWGSSSNYDVDEIIGQDEISGMNTNGAMYVVTGTSSANVSWWSLPFVGELWPDNEYYSNWSGNNPGNATWGNLNNKQEGGDAFRLEHQNQNSSLFSYAITYHRNGPQGCATFFNGSNGGSGSTFNHQTNQFNANLLNDGVVMSSDYNFALPSTFNVTRAWSDDDGTNTPPEWGLPTATKNYLPYINGYTHLDVYSGDPTSQVPDTSWGFYDDNTGSAVYNKSSAAVRSVYVNPQYAPPPPGSGLSQGTANGGWFVMNGLAPSTQSGFNFVAQFAILACLRTYHDAGVPTAAANFTSTNNIYNSNTYRIPPDPLVTISHPTGSDPVQGQTTLPIYWDLRYARWDNAQYTTNYPCIDANVGACISPNIVPKPQLEWHDPQNVGFNIIYNMPTSVSPTAWYSALTGNLCSPGPGNNYVPGGSGSYMDGADAIFPGTSYEYSPYYYKYTWNNVAPALYNLQVECFRISSNQAGAGQEYPHYAYHQIQLNTVP